MKNYFDTIPVVEDGANDQVLIERAFRAVQPKLTRGFAAPLRPCRP